MFKLVVLLTCIVAVIVAEPGYLGGAYGLGNGYGHGSYGYAIPSAVSHQSSIAIHNKPIITTVAAAPVIVKPQLVAAIPAATSHQSRVDLISKSIIYSKPIVSVAAPQLSYGTNYVASSPFVRGLYGNGYNELSGFGLGYGNIYGYANYRSHY